LTLLLAILALLASGCDISDLQQPTKTAPSAAQTAGAAPQAQTTTAQTTTAAATTLPAATTAAAVTAAATSPQAATGPMLLSTAVRDVVQRARPAVVQITSEQVQVDQFDRPFGIPAGVGSGVIYDNQGHILTNYHVIEDAERLLVSLPDGRSFPGTLVGGDPQTDLAVLRVDEPNLPMAQLGDSKQLQVGDWIVAIGNALGLPGGPTVTAGVVSALNRTVQEPGSPTTGQGPYLYDVIQTDAAINPGNSGGPLIDLNGRVVGINTLVAGQAESGIQAQGIGFAIAINTAKPVADQLVSTGRAVHPYLGIRYTPLNPAISAQLGTRERNGVLVQQVVSGSPAARAGLRARDIVVEFDGRPLQTDSALGEAINTHRPGDTISLTIVRGNQRSTVQVTLGEMPPNQ
jgi:S1-C subfamily serine protease